jgi:hypothetical protein
VPCNLNKFKVAGAREKSDLFIGVIFFIAAGLRPDKEAGLRPRLHGENAGCPWKAEIFWGEHRFTEGMEREKLLGFSPAFFH